MSITIRRAGRKMPPPAQSLRHAQSPGRYPATPLRLAAPLAAATRAAGRGHCAAGRSDNLVVGNLTLWQEPNPRRRHVASLGMAVRDDWAGRGVGTALMAAALDLADNWLGLTRLELTVWSDNEAAQALYRKFGFEQEGVARDYGLRHGVLVDTLYMARVRS